jgi:threonine dehydratase
MEKLTLPTLDEIKTASKRLKNITIHTPLIRYNGTSNIYLKLETLQPVTSFKLRGVYNAAACLPKELREKGLSTISSGNTAIALGWTGRYLGVPAKTYVPNTTPSIKIETMQSYGMEVVKLPPDELMKWYHEKGWERESYNFIHPWHNRDLQAGHGTMGLETVAYLPDVETVYVPVGGGGLISGIGNALKLLNPDIRVVGVESEACASLYCSFEAGKAVQIQGSETICDGSNVPLITDELYPLLRKVVDDSVTVSEKEVKKTMKTLMLKHKLIVEGSGAFATTAASKEPIESRGKSVSIISGGSIDTDKIIAILTDPNL